MVNPKTPDFLIIGGGIIGLCIALEAKRRHPDCHVTLIEKEANCGLHASTRNSGVLHAGFYYTAESLKARLTREGNKRLKIYCAERNLKINPCGKLVVAKNIRELEGLDELLRRARANNIELHMISSKEAKEIEPRIKTYEKALFSPTTASVNPKEVISSLVKDTVAQGIDILTDTAYVSRTSEGIRTTQGLISSGYVINAAGLYADKVARNFGFSQDYQIIPFKGLYLYADGEYGKLRTNIYPVPDLTNPFLGVHFTITAEGMVKIGPTAIPAFWRENYLGFRNFKFDEFFEITKAEAGLFFRNDFNFRKLAFSEIQKFYKPKLVKLASELLMNVKKEDYNKWGPPGIRAQLLNIKKRKLEMDFRYEGDNRSFHVLNAVSPAFTCSFSFSEFIFDQIEKLIH